MSKFFVIGDKNKKMFVGAKNNLVTNAKEARIYVRKSSASNSWNKIKSSFRGFDFIPLEFNFDFDSGFQTTPTTPVQTKIATHVAVLLDSSGSMKGIKDRVVHSANTLVAQFLADAKANGQEITIDVWSFDDGCSIIRTYSSDDVDVRSMTVFEYYRGGMTAIYDSVMKACNTLQNKFHNNTNDAYLVYLITDGQENASRSYNSITFEDNLRRLNNTDRWTFLAQVPKGGKQSLVNFGYMPGNVEEWDCKDVESAVVRTSTGTQSYLAARSIGKTSVKGFYVDTDLSKVTDSDIHKLQDLSSQFDISKVENKVGMDEKGQYRINLVYEAKRKRPYTAGTAFYELMKSEKIQWNKQVMLFDKKNNKLYGGAEARKLIGLPTNAQEVHVNPMNHSHYIIFVQSNSHNRILPVGTKVALLR
jgi:hypothetical protein